MFSIVAYNQFYLLICSSESSVASALVAVVAGKICLWRNLLKAINHIRLRFDGKWKTSEKSAFGTHLLWDVYLACVCLTHTHRVLLLRRNSCWQRKIYDDYRLQHTLCSTRDLWMHVAGNISRDRKSNSFQLQLNYLHLIRNTAIYNIIFIYLSLSTLHRERWIRWYICVALVSHLHFFGIPWIFSLSGLCVSVSVCVLFLFEKDEREFDLGNPVYGFSLFFLLSLPILVSRLLFALQQRCAASRHISTHTHHTHTHNIT